MIVNMHESKVVKYSFYSFLHLFDILYIEYEVLTLKLATPTILSFSIPISKTPFENLHLQEVIPKLLSITNNS